MEISRNNNTISFIKNGNHVGKCNIRDKKPELHISFITIYKNFRGQNLSSEFWKLLEGYFIENGYNKITLETDEFTDKRYGKLVSLYESWGFKIVDPSKERYVYDNTGEFMMRKVPMVKILNLSN